MFFDVFYALCKKKGVSCKKATEEMGLSNSIATKWKKTGATPTVETLEIISDYFKVPMDYLLGKETEKAPTTSGERSISDDDLIFALWGDNKEITDEDLDDVRRYAAFVAQRRKEKK